MITNSISKTQKKYIKQGRVGPYNKQNTNGDLPWRMAS